MNPYKIKDVINCNLCESGLYIKNEKILCTKCQEEIGIIEENIPVLHGCKDKVGFFDKKITEDLSKRYENFSHDGFEDILNKVNLHEMDIANKKIGISQKEWWGKYLGAVKNRKILEVGCGVNYIVPYWIDTNNTLVAFDICKESVKLLKSIIENLKLKNQDYLLFVGDAEKISFKEKFDIININNSLHHMNNKEDILRVLKNTLNNSGNLLIVEPNYYYPLRWIIETDFLEQINIIKKYFIKHDLIEKGEKAIIFKDLKSILKKLAFKIIFNEKDNNYLGYGVCYFIDKNKFLPKLIFFIDKHILSPLIPKILSPFEYLILKK